MRSWSHAARPTTLATPKWYVTYETGTGIEAPVMTGIWTQYAGD